MIKGKQLSEKRKRFGHWIAQNRAPIHEGMSFVDLLTFCTPRVFYAENRNALI